MLFKNILAIAISTVLINPLSSKGEVSTSVTAAVDEYVISEMKKRGIPGLALSVVLDGEILKSKGYGFSHVALQIPVTPETVFRTASITKVFTASAIMSLVEHGKLSLDLGIRDILPECPESWAGITARHLLTHMSGLNDDTWYGTHRLRAYQEDPVRPAGEKFEYSDFGYNVLGLVIEKASGKPYRKYLADLFFGPLGMVSSSVGVPTGRAIPYRLIDEKLVRSYSTAADGGLFSNVRDLTIWDNALSEGRVLKSSSLEEMWTPLELANGSHRTYGLGWTVFEIRGHRVVGHGGALGHYYLHFPEDELTVIILTNLAMAEGSDPRTIAEGVASHYLTDLRISVISLQQNWNDEIERAAKASLHDIARNDRNSPYLIPAFRSTLSQTSWSGLVPHWISVSDIQKLEMIACMEPRKLQSIRHNHSVTQVCYARLITETEDRYFEFYFSANGKIVHIHASTE